MQLQVRSHLTVLEKQLHAQWKKVTMWQSAIPHDAGLLSIVADQCQTFAVHANRSRPVQCGDLVCRTGTTHIAHLKRILEGQHCNLKGSPEGQDHTAPINLCIAVCPHAPQVRFVQNIACKDNHLALHPTRPNTHREHHSKRWD